MSEQVYDQISAFVDGELPEPETELLLRRLDRDPEFKATFVRYVTIGASLRTDGSSRLGQGLLARVRSAVASEAGAGGSRVSLRSRLPRRVMRAVGGLAVAAGVAALAILGVRQMQPAEVEPGAPQVAAVAVPSSTTVVIGDPASAEAPSYTVPLPSTSRPLVPAARLTNYAIAHSEYSSPLGRRNVLSGVIAEDPIPLDEPVADASSPAVPSP